METKCIRVALIGCGRIAYKHIEALSHLNEKFELVAVCDIVTARAEERALAYESATGKNKTVKVYADYKEMLTKETFDFGIVATESGNHYAHVMALLNADKHVLVEKPIALSTKHAQEMVKTAKNRNKLLGVCHQNRFNPPIKALREAVDQKRFGRLMNGTARILWTRDEGYYQQAPWRGTAAMDGGTLMNQCIHNIDLLIWMMNSPVKTVYAQTETFMRNIEMEDFGAIVLRFESGAIGIIEGSACVYPKNLEETLSIFGSTGTVVIGGLAVNEIKTWQFETTLPNDKLLENQAEVIENVYGNGHERLYENFYDALTGQGTLLVDGTAGSEAMKVILAAYQSQVEGRVVSMAELNYATTNVEKRG